MSLRHAAAFLGVLAVAALTPLPALSASPAPPSNPAITDGPSVGPIASSTPVLALSPLSTPTLPAEAPASSPSASPAPAAARSASPTSPKQQRAPAATQRPTTRAKSGALPAASAVASAPVPSAGATPGVDRAGTPFPGGAGVIALGALALMAALLVVFGRPRREALLPNATPPGTPLNAELPQSAPAVSRRPRISADDDPILIAMGLGRRAPVDPPATAATNPPARRRPGRAPAPPGSRHTRMRKGPSAD